MSDSFFKVNRGLTLNPQSEYGSGDPAGTDGDIYYNSVLNAFRVFQDGSWSNLSSGGSGGNIYVAKQVVLTNGTTSFAVSFTTPQPDTSYIVLGMMVNTVDAFPQYQQLEITSKSTTGFVFSWNHPIDSANYSISYIVPPKTLPVAETPISLGANTLASTLLIAQGSSGYGVIAELQNIVDAHPQFQSVVVGANTTNTVNLSWNVATDTANYVATYMIGAVGQIAVSNGVTSVTVPLPVNYNAINYGIVASMQNTIDPNPRFQPMVVTAVSGQSVTFSWNAITDTANYLLNYYAISATS